MFKHDYKLQEYVNIMYNEGREDDLIKICDMYHGKFDSLYEAVEWGLNLGEYIGKFRFGDKLWKFDLPCGDKAIYFIGEKEEVSKKISAAL